MELTAEGGRSSDKDLPFFLIQNEAMRAGMFVAFGWSGQWLTRTSVDHAAQTLDVKGRVPGLNIALKPGEEIQGATVLLGLYEGTLSDGSNRLRRLIRDVYTPLLGGERFLPIATYDTWFDLGLKYDEPLLRKLADAAAEIGQEYFLLDAGWYAGTKGDWDFSAGVGNWYEIDRGRLPGGIKPIADYVRSKGLKIGMFFEPERVARESTLAKEHADWILWKHAEEPENAFNSIMRNSQFGLLDYGRPEVQQWVRSMMDHYIRDLDVRYIRYDFNIDPLPYWNANDKKDRRGMTQLRYIQGLYAIMDWLRARNPNTVFEGCATGGRRIDLETVRRFHTFWISDQTDDPAITRFHQFGINHFLPGNYHYIQYTLPSRQGFQPDDLGFQSLFGGAFGTNGRIDQWPEPLLKKTRLHVDTWKKHRRYLVEDYYPLGDQPADMESWSGWQFQDPKDQSGYIQIFRTRTPGATHRFQLRSLDERARYRFMDAYSEEEFEVSGAVAMTTGIEVTQAPMSSRVFVYRKMSPAGFE
jgi:alpha-galactosidase